MTLSNEEITKWIGHLSKETQEAFGTAQDLSKSKRYHFALFFCHLALEKKLKAFFLSQKKKFAPPVHDVIYLVKKLEPVPNQEVLSQLAEINTFNIRARYEDYKREFYKKATSEYTEKWLNLTKKLLIYFDKKL